MWYWEPSALICMMSVTLESTVVNSATTVIVCSLLVASAVPYWSKVVNQSM